MRSTIVAGLIGGVALGALTACAASSDPSAPEIRPSSSPTTTSQSAMTTTTTIEPDATSSELHGTPRSIEDELSEFALGLRRAMQDIGVDQPAPADHTTAVDQNAQLWGQWRGRLAYVYGHPPGKYVHEGAVVGSRTVAGIDAEVVAARRLGDVIRFQCGEHSYDVGSMPGDIGGDFGRSQADHAAILAEALIPQLCPPRSK